MKKLLSLVALLLASLVLSACGGGADSGGASGADSSAAEFNNADVEFAQSMIPHHRQAVEMAQLAQDRAESPEVKQLASDIEAAQGPEIEQLTTWLEAWGEDVPEESTDGGMGGMDMGGDSSMDMGSMMSSEDMDKLSAASGAEFDRMFLEMMTVHHEGAIEMAKTEVAEGENPDAITMAENIVSSQQAEIETMEKLLAS